MLADLMMLRPAPIIGARLVRLLGATEEEEQTIKALTGKLEDFKRQYKAQLRRAIDEYTPRIDDYPAPKRFKFPLREAIDASIWLVKNGFEDAATARGVSIAMGLPEKRAVKIFGGE